MICATKAGDFQPFPSEGPLKENLNITPQQVEQIAAQNPKGKVYAYVLTTATWDAPHTGKLTQRGSAPNFQGRRITLCTCKHTMRAGNRGLWKRTWVAGFCSGAQGQTYGLFYLMRVAEEFDSHVDLWNALSPVERIPKSMARHPLGDIMEPLIEDSSLPGKERFAEHNYKPVHQNHVHVKLDKEGIPGWRKDLDFSKFDQHRRLTPLLLGDPANSFLWSRPRFEFNGKLPRTKKFPSLANLIHHLKVIA